MSQPSAEDKASRADEGAAANKAVGAEGTGGGGNGGLRTSTLLVQLDADAGRGLLGTLRNESGYYGSAHGRAASGGTVRSRVKGLIGRGGANGGSDGANAGSHGGGGGGGGGGSGSGGGRTSPSPWPIEDMIPHLMAKLRLPGPGGSAEVVLGPQRRVR